MARRNRNAYAAKWSKELTLLIPKGRGFSAQRPLPASRSYMGRQWSANRESPGFSRGECQGNAKGKRSANPRITKTPPLGRDGQAGDSSFLRD